MTALLEPLCAFWCRIPSRPNFGDGLTPWLIRAITGRYPRFVPAGDPRPKYFVTGSVIGYADVGATVWGSGILGRWDAISLQARLLAVRGPLTRARALECGADCPEVYGDPALLLPRFHHPAARPRRGVGIAPHFSDMPRLAASFRRCDELRLIDLQAPIEQVIDEIASCEMVASSSLHGIVTSHAYGIPALWIEFRQLPSGDGSKFRDYYLSTGQEPPPPFRSTCDRIDPDALQCRAMPAPRLDLEPLWRACPFGRDA